jgi:hypothetical protein
VLLPPNVAIAHLPRRCNGASAVHHRRWAPMLSVNPEVTTIATTELISGRCLRSRPARPPSSKTRASDGWWSHRTSHKLYNRVSLRSVVGPSATRSGKRQHWIGTDVAEQWSPSSTAIASAHHSWPKQRPEEAVERLSVAAQGARCVGVDHADCRRTSGSNCRGADRDSVTLSAAFRSRMAGPGVWHHCHAA